MTGALAASHAIVFRAIAAAADRGDVCPTNAELGDMIAGGSPVACASIQALQRKGYITVRRFAHARQVTIVETGKSTRHDGSTTPHWRDAKAQRGNHG